MRYPALLGQARPYLKSASTLKSDHRNLFARRGGFIFNQVHNIQANVPPENILAMFDAAYEFRAHHITVPQHKP